MARYEYTALAAPRRAGRVKGARSAEDRSAAALSVLLNDMAAEGWEYLRADTLPFEERSGFAQWTTVFRTLLVFRRPQPQHAPEQTHDSGPPVALPPPNPEPAVAPNTGRNERLQSRDDS